MKKYEKLSLSISSLALIISIVSPFVIYSWLNNFELKKKYRPILTVTTTESITLSPDDVQIQPNDSYKIKNENNLSKKKTHYMYTLSVFNEGKSPAQDVYLYIYPVVKEFRWPNDFEITTDPPDTFTKTTVDGNLRITLDRAIASGERLTFFIRGITLSKSNSINILDGKVYHRAGEAEKYYNEKKTIWIFSEDK